MKKRGIVVAIILVILAGYFVWFERESANNKSLLGNDKISSNIKSMQLTSTVFERGGKIPSKYTCDGENINVPLVWDEVPEGVKSFVLIMDDPDIPEAVKKSRGIEVFDHWVVFNIPPTVTGVAEGMEPSGTLGSNGAGKTRYIGPCPPDREHRYFFKLYALDTTLNLSVGSTKKQVEDAMDAHIMAQAELVGRYERGK